MPANRTANGSEAGPTPSNRIPSRLVTRRAGKYARFELERKFLLDSMPEGTSDNATICDRYIKGTSLRLRRAELPDGRVEYKLNQKANPSPPDYGVMTITTLYLSAKEYEVLLALPAHELRKRRYHLGPYSIDVFEAALAGLLLAEIELGSEDEMKALVVPEFAVRDVSDDVRYTGGRLAANGLPQGGQPV
jgi:CYTH domain-containing protein